MNKKIIAGIIIGLVLGSVSVYAGTKFYASDVSVTAPIGSGLGSNATLQNALDDLYSKLSYKDGTAIYYNPNTGKNTIWPWKSLGQSICIQKWRCTSQEDGLGQK